ncbi:MAG TPA: hypothetical protein VLH09_09505, partial [Bryobacteraceae bacterium]|nr:hypothetical protein [Bryobacteraceae bacterium]
PNHGRVIVSHVRGAVGHLTGKGRREAEELDIEPLVPKLPDAAYAYAESKGYHKPANYRSSAELFVSTLFSNGGTPQPSPVQPRHPDWDPLFAALEKYRTALENKLVGEGKDPKRRLGPQLSTLEQFRSFVFRHGIESPRGIPSYQEVRRWADEDGLNQGQWDARIHAYRFSARLLPGAGYPELMRETWARDRGVRSLPDLGDRLRRLGCTEDSRNMTTLQILTFLAPRMTRALLHRLEWGRQRDRSEEWEKSNLDAVSRVVASMIRLGLDPLERSLFGLFTEVVQVVDANPSISDLVAFELGGRKPEAREVSLIQCVVDECREPAAALSPLSTRTSTEGEGAPPSHFVATVPADVNYIFAMVRQVYEDDLSQLNSTLWKSAEGTLGRVLKYMRDHNDQLHIDGHLRKKLVAGYGELICVSLAKLRNEAQERLQALDDFRIASADKLHLSTVQDELQHLEGRADTELENYIIAAVPFDDGLREKNYARAIAGKHFVPKVITDEEGRPLAFEYVETVFVGNDHQDVRLKMKKRTRGRRRVSRERRRRLSRGIVDHHLLFRFWYETRARNAVRRGLISSVAEFDFQNDGYAVFIGSKAPAKRCFRSGQQSERYVQTGRLTKGAWANRFKRTLKRMLAWIDVEVPKRSDPAFAEWRGILGPHIVRSVIATYWGGLRSNWALACYLTDDTEDVLDEHYVALKDDLGRLMGMTGPRNPRWFDEVLDRLVADKNGEDWTSFWASFDPARPETWRI